MSRKVPNVIIIGSMKSATSTLAWILGEHPAALFSYPKEPEVLVTATSDRDAQEQYRTLFSRGSASSVLAEGSTAYTKPAHSESCAAKAKNVCGSELKLIVSLRDPVERLESHVRHELNAGRLRESDVSEQLRKDPIYIGTSQYADRLRPWVENFGVSQLLPVIFDDIANHPEAVSRSVFEFLGLPPFKVNHVDTELQNSSSSRVKLGERWKPVARSRAYRQFIRPMLPRKILRFGVSMVATTEKGSVYTLNEQDRDWARNQLHGEQSKLRELLGNQSLQIEGH